ARRQCRRPDVGSQAESREVGQEAAAEEAGGEGGLVLAAPEVGERGPWPRRRTSCGRTESGGPSPGPPSPPSRAGRPQGASVPWPACRSLPPPAPTTVPAS